MVSNYNEDARSFLGNPSSNTDQSTMLDPYSLFNIIFDDDTVGKFAEETYRYHSQFISQINYVPSRIIEWKDLTGNEIRSFLSVLVVTGINRRSSLLDHSSKMHLLKSNIYKQISERRFKLIW
jgi:hypothetical protein